MYLVLVVIGPEMNILVNKIEHINMVSFQNLSLMIEMIQLDFI